MASKLPLPIEEIARLPLPGTAIPGAFAFSPDGHLLTYLFSPDGSLTRQLYAVDPAGGEPRPLLQLPDGGANEENLSLEQKLRRERMRQLELGITGFAWAKQGTRLLVPLPSGLYVLDAPGAEPHLVLETGDAPALDPQLSPDGQWIAYVQDAELYVISAAGGEPVQITSGARGSGRTNGLAEYVAQEEMDRRQGFWWSLDSRWLAFQEVDETHIPSYRIMHQGKDAVGSGAQEDHRYPFAGQSNARVRLGVVSRKGDEAPRWLDLAGDGLQHLPAAGWEYLARVVWMPDGSLAVQVENRQQTRLELLRFDPQSAQRTTLLSESNQVWINLHDLFKPLERGGFLWASERTGFCHLYLYEDTGRMLRQLTDGDWMVDSVAGVDETQGMVYFTATRESPLESHLYVVSLTGGDPRRITQQPGMHAVTLDSACRCFVDEADAIDRPPMVSVRSLPDGGLVRTLFEPGDARLTELDLRPPVLVSFATRDGVELHGAIFQPSVTDSGPGSYPTIVSVYGGPHVQRVVNGWRTTVAMRAQYLRSQGFLVFMLDNRGSARRGLAFEGAIKHRLGHVEVEDQVDGVRWLVERGLADPQRVGVYGWSYGGYMACLCLAKAPETFRVAVAGAPVASWDGYDTHYTERYMDTPQANGAGYETSSVMPHVPGMEGELLLVHGLIDENVHFRHTARLINALIRARKPYQLLLFPDERHTPRRLEDRVFLEEQVVGFFQRYL